MSELSYVTRGMVPPSGKPRVLFVSHPDDDPLYFSRISRILLDCRDCAVWRPGAAPMEPDDLLQMQLFVMPVTTALLTTSNPALEQLLPFARAHHIPVLPLMMESGLDELFLRSCGDLQYLEPHSQDLTAIPFEQKLEGYLSSVLIDGALAERIRGAFRASLFLSYRKMDRAGAGALLRSLHARERLQDVAIWYDEFLVPGEGFNGGIRTALENSSIFLMHVTPNLLSNPNYIMTTEYPAAVAAGKPILPLMAEPTDLALLSRFYPGIPACIDAGDPSALSAALAEICRLLPPRQDAAPERTYLLGMAYLGGLDVEVDPERGVSLITAAAQAGWTEAMGTLVDLYRMGTGVAPNALTAIEWQERKLAALDAQLKRRSPNVSPEQVISEHYRCGDLHRACFRYDRAIKAYRAGMEIVQKQLRWERSPSLRRIMAAGYLRLGDVCLQKGDLHTARTQIRKGLDHTEARAKADPVPENLQDLADCYRKLGLLCRTAGKPAAAKEALETALALEGSLDVSTPRLRRSINLTCNLLGDVLMTMNRLPEATEYFRRSLAVSLQNAEEVRTFTARRDLAMAYNRLADALHAAGALEDAAAHFQEEITLCEALSQEQDSLQSTCDLYTAYQKYGDVLNCMDAPDRAREYFLRGHRLCEALWGSTRLPGIRADLAVSLFRLACVSAKPEQERLLSRSESMLRELCRSHPRVAQYRVYLQTVQAAKRQL